MLKSTSTIVGIPAMTGSPKRTSLSGPRIDELEADLDRLLGHLREQISQLAGGGALRAPRVELKALKHF